VQLWAGAWAGVAIGCAVVAGLVGFVVHKGLQLNKLRDADKSAQLAYINEMTEGDIKERDEADAEERAAVSGWGLAWGVRVTLRGGLLRCSAA